MIRTVFSTAFQGNSRIRLIRNQEAAPVQNGMPTALSHSVTIGGSSRPMAPASSRLLPTQSIQSMAPLPITPTPYRDSREVLTLKRQNVSSYSMAVAKKPTRSTVYLEPEWHRAHKIQAVETSSSISKPVNRAVRDALPEDREDLIAFDKRASESTMKFEELVERMNLDGEV